MPNPPESQPADRWTIGDARLLRHSAIQVFKHWHQFLVGTPSGNISWNLTVSAKPGNWHLLSRTKPGELFSETITYGGAIAPPTRHHRKTDLEIHACISPDIRHFYDFTFRTPPFGFSLIEKLLLIGFHEIDPLPHSERSFKAHVALPSEAFQLTPAIRLILITGPVQTIAEPNLRRASRAHVRDIRNFTAARLIGSTRPGGEDWDRAGQGRGPAAELNLNSNHEP